METGTPLLRFAGAALALERGGVTAPVSFSIDAGDFAVADLRGPLRCAAFADAAVGLVPPRSGRVVFEGREWREAAPEQAAAMRGRIGRHFARDTWLPEIGIEENILLAPVFHTYRAVGAVRDEAARLAASFGLPGLPTGPAAALSAGDRHRAGLVRAFLNAPDLVILEEPVGDEPAALLPPLMAAIRTVRDRGGAVLLLTSGLGPAIDRSLPATQRLRLVHGALESIETRAA